MPADQQDGAIQFLAQCGDDGTNASAPQSRHGRGGVTAEALRKIFQLAHSKKPPDSGGNRWFHDAHIVAHRRWRRKGRPLREDFWPQIKLRCTRIKAEEFCLFHLCASDLHLWQRCIFLPIFVFAPLLHFGTMFERFRATKCRTLSLSLVRQVVCKIAHSSEWALQGRRDLS